MKIRENEWVTINIEKHHIELGKQNDCNACPVALALMEEFCDRGLFANVKEADEISLVAKHDNWGVYAVIDVHEDDQDEINRFIHDFDTGIISVKFDYFSFRCRLNDNQLGA